MKHNPRQVVFNALYDIIIKDAYAEVARDRALAKTNLTSQDQRFVSELIYGIVRRQRTLETLIDQFASKPASQQPPKLRLILLIGLYQLRYLTQVPDSAAVDTSVELAKTNGLGKLSGVINGILRNYSRQQETNTISKNWHYDPIPPTPLNKGGEGGIYYNLSFQNWYNTDPLKLPDNPISRIGILHSFPDWIVKLWWEEFGEESAIALAQWFNQAPNIDLRINPLQTTQEAVENALTESHINYSRLPLPNGLRLSSGVGNIQQLPGFTEGWWTVQDYSAQLVSYLLNPQPGETIIDACAAPGGKSTHIAELMGDQGIIYSSDRASSRLKKVTQNAQRLNLHSIQTCVGDVRNLFQFKNSSDRVLVDAPCSGLGTLHRRTDLRWRQTPENLLQLAQLQQEILTEAATWVKPNGILVYATCTINPLENEEVIQAFLANHPQWQIVPPAENFPALSLVSSSNFLKILPTEHNSDGFFMVKLKLTPM